MKFDLLIFIIYYGTFLCNSNESYVAAFLSDYMDQEFEIKESIMGVVFALNSLGELSASLALSKLLKTRFLTRRQMLLIGCFMQATSTVIFMFMNLFEYKGDEEEYEHSTQVVSAVIALSLISRLVNGFVIFLGRYFI